MYLLCRCEGKSYYFANPDVVFYVYVFVSGLMWSLGNIVLFLISSKETNKPKFMSKKIVSRLVTTTVSVVCVE